MDDIQTLASLSYDRALAIKNLEEKQMSRLSVTYNGGIWLCNTELMSLLQFYDQHSEVVLLDANKIPRLVDPLKLAEIVAARHQEVLNDWMVEYHQLAKIRTAKHVL